jgi:hypothetical protein
LDDGKWQGQPWSGRGTSRLEQPLEERLQQLISSRLQTVISSVFLSQVNEINDEVKAMLEKLNDRMIGLEDLVKSREENQSETSSDLPCSPTKKSKHGSSSDGIVILKEFGDSSSVFKTRLRERVRRYCLSREGHMYFPPNKTQVI